MHQELHTFALNVLYTFAVENRNVDMICNILLSGIFMCVL